ncbi:hypothetical protein K435DRAFT_461970 [Dendrothele bispora CBS 962.96]|uniref:Uncharacterized protein n=1 Tax=Dendrothele bispora (strain CBS 962.96) TaxID=1314807 RepID=A0A4V4HGV4_DENBC|nr:hypothetical protein K435DRAFT_461970 [Dendrothele bispora CBS 962.96]
MSRNRRDVAKKHRGLSVSERSLSPDRYYPARHSIETHSAHHRSSHLNRHENSTSSFSPSSSPIRASSSDIDNNIRVKRKIELTELTQEKEPREKANRNLGRRIRRTIALFSTVQTLVKESDRRAMEKGDENGRFKLEDDEDTSDDNQREKLWRERELKRTHDRLLTGYNLLCETVPGFRKMIQSDVEAAELTKYYSELDLGANGARVNDVNNIRGKVAEWLNCRRVPPRPPLKGNTRVGRGFRNPATGRLLCPIDLDWDNAQTRADIQQRKVSIKRSQFFFCIRGLYLNEVGDPNDMEKGFLKGDLLVKTFRAIFTAGSPNDEIGGDLDEERPTKRRKSTCKNNAQLINMTAVTPRAIAYAAVMLRFALSEVEKWGMDHSFNYEAFWNAIVDYFEEVEPGSDEEDQIRKLLDWWNQKIFPGDNVSTSSKPLRDFKSVLTAQRAAKAAARLQQAQAS